MQSRQLFLLLSLREVTVAEIKSVCGEQVHYGVLCLTEWECSGKNLVIWVTLYTLKEHSIDLS